MHYRAPLIAVLAAAVAACAACSDKGSSSDASTDGQEDQSCPSSGEKGEGGCNAQEPVPGACCTAGENICTPEGFDPCCLGYTWVCMSGGWTKMALGCACMMTDAGADSGIKDAAPDGPAGTACGKATCKADEACVVDHVGKTTTHTCTPIPAKCKGKLTCACAKDACGEGGADMCSVKGSTLTCKAETD
jgi:hypothetical protein